MSTQEEVAKLAGVSPPIVSYVLNNSNYVSEEKREAVLRAVKELDYHPNYIAQSLRQRKTRTFAVLIRDARNEMYTNIIYYLETIAYKMGYFISVTSIESQQKANDYLATLMARKFDAIFLATNIYSREQLDRLVNCGIPIVLYQYREYENLNPAISVFRPPALEAVKEAVDYLIEERGHRMVGCLSYGDPKSAGESGPYGQGFCMNGYLTSLREHDIPVPADWVIHLENPDVFVDMADGLKSVARRYAQTPPGERPSAFFTSLDSIAAMLIVELRNNGVRVPEDLEVIGFGNSPSSVISNPAITTVGIDCKQAAQIVLEMLIDGSEGKPPETRAMPLTFIRRASA